MGHFKPRKKRSFVWMLFNSLAVFFAILLIFAFLATFVNPAKFVWFAYFGLLFPFFLTINILFAVFLLFNLKKTVAIPLLAIVLNWANIQNMVQFNSPDFSESENSIRILSYNVNLFDHYGHINPRRGETQREILNFLTQEMPDIIAFQEYREDLRELEITRFLAHHLDLRYSSVSRVNNRMAFGNIIFSRFPIIRDSLIRFDDSRNMIVFADIVAHGDTIRVINFHLESIGFQREDDLFYLEFMSAPTETADFRKGVGRMLSRMNRAYAARAEQAQILAQLIADSPFRTIAAGDLNDIPVSFTYRTVARNMNDAFRRRGFGLGTTYRGIYPSFRIDYIFYSDGFSCENFTTIRVGHSDHFPIIAEFKIDEL